MNLKPDDFEVDMVIAVTTEPFTYGTTTDWKSTVWQISAVDLPFLVLDSFPRSQYGGRRTVDSRQFQFKKLSPEFVDALQKAKG